MDREEAIRLAKANVQQQNTLNHMLAVEAIMKALAEHLGEDVALWGLTGLLHDIDFDKTIEKPEEHGIRAEEILKGKVPEEVLRAIKAHNHEHTGVVPEVGLDKALIASDALSGLIVACALVMPSKKIRDVQTKTTKKKFKDKSFARGADRERIALCEELGISKEEFFEIALKGIQPIGKEIGL